MEGKMTRTRRLVAMLAAILAALAIAACGSSSKSSSTGSSGAANPAAGGGTTTAQKDATIAAEVPAAIKSKGTLTVAADASYAPNEFIKPGSKTVIGMDPDLAAALASVMGLKANVQNATFDSIIPGLAANKYDLGMSSFTDTKERQKTVDFVTYFSAGTSFYTKAQGGPAINTLADLCGHKVAAEKGTTQATDAQAQSKKCTSGGKPAVTVLVYPDQNGANLALSSGRADVGMADSPVAAYLTKQSGGQFKVVGQTYGQAPYGIAMPKKSGLQKPVQDALKKLIAGGQYKAILTKWGVQAGAITKPVINGATS
jgi:polar amino acid transport system substrate-binding protein